ncbi:MAG: hypothetical protein CMJ32_03705 [Phycisphaerae bacterium]|nr:hypothetical protein [Phycisphaerae bacterium]
MTQGFGFGGGMGMGLGMIIMPISIILMIRRQPPGPLKLMLRAGATSPAMARKLTTLGIARPSMLSADLKRGTIIRLEGGRYYLDQSAYRRSRWRQAIIIAFVISAGTALVVAMLLEVIIPSMTDATG